MSKVYYNGTIISMEDSDYEIEAILVEDGIIAKVGTVEKIRKSASTDTEFVDLEGKTLMPSFIDAHGHIAMAAQMSNACNLAKCETFEEVVDTLSEFKAINNIADDDLIFGFGYDHNFLPNEQHPTKDILDQVSADIPIFLLHTSAHMGCVNSKVLDLMSVNETTENPSGGIFGRVENSTEPNGYLEENAMFSVMGLVNDKLQVDIFEAMRKTQLEYLRNGITTAQEGASNKETVGLLTMLAEQDKLLIDIVSYPIITPEVTEIFETHSKYVNQYYNKFKIGGYKVVLDGSPQGKSAWLTKPYENSGDYAGYPWFEDAQVEEFMDIAIRDNQQVLVHCNGDASGDQFLNSYEKALEKANGSQSLANKDLRPVMIHCQTAREDQLDKMAELDIIPSIFVGHVYYWGDVHLRNLGPERGTNVSPVQTAFDRNLIVNFHQDTPVTEPNPLLSVWAAVNRVTRGGIVLGEHQRCTVFDALKAITINGAYSYFEEDVKGTIAEGKIADLVILDNNPLEIDPMKIKDIKVLETIKNGVSYLNIL